MIRRLWTLPLLLLSFCTATLHAQSKLAIYGTFGGEKSGLANQGWTTAGTVGLYVGVTNLGPIALSVDGRADLSSSIKSGLLGPRVALHFPAFPLKPYAEILIGESTYPNRPDGLTASDKFVSRVVGGIDTAILPHVDWRILDFSYGINRDDHAETLSSGIVLRF